MGNNAYKLELPGTYGVSATFNVADLIPYLAVDEDLDSWSNPFQEGEVDAGPSSTPPNTSIILGDGPMTRARAKKLQRDSFMFVSHALFSSTVQLPEPTLKTYMCIGIEMVEPP